MDRLQFQLDPDEDVAGLYRRLVGAEAADADHAARHAAWEAFAEAMTTLRDVAEAAGVPEAAFAAFDDALLEAARAAAQSNRVAFDAGLRAGAALAGLQGPSTN